MGAPALHQKAPAGTPSQLPEAAARALMGSKLHVNGVVTVGACGWPLAPVRAYAHH